MLALLEIAVQCYDSELPALETASQYRAIVISGSHYSCYEDRPWILALKDWIKQFVQAESTTILVGICFGNQVTQHVVTRSAGGSLRLASLHPLLICFMN